MGKPNFTRLSSHRTDNSWSLWLAEHAGKFLLFARQQTRCGQDAEDVLQEALVETWRRADGRPETALVFATIRRRAIDLARRTGRRAAREEEEAASAALWFEPVTDDRETAELIETAVRRLPAEQREVITLKLWGGLTFAETARALEIPQGTAASRYRLAIDALRETLTPVLT